jgi:hypothetical protein
MVKQINVWKHNTRIIGLDNILKEMAETRQQRSDKVIAGERLEE